MIDVGALLLAGTTLLALGAIFVLPPAYENHRRERARQRNLKQLMQMHSRSKPLPTVPSLDRLRAAARSKDVASPTPPDSGLAAVSPKHRRAD